jgi:hypothetical protein
MERRHRHRRDLAMQGVSEETKGRMKMHWTMYVAGVMFGALSGWIVGILVARRYLEKDRK